MEIKSKNSTGKNNFYFKVLNELKTTTNLTKIQKNLNISKQQLNYYLRRLKKSGLIINKSKGLWELTNSCKNPTKYGKFLPKDFTRGHGIVVEIKFPKKIKNWEKRIEILEKNNINFKLVGALKTTPRIKALGRKVWLCNDHLRIFDKKNQSYYGENAVESRKQAFWEFYKIIGVIENKLGVNLRPFDFHWKKEHYALIKNDLAINQNQKGVIWRISDEDGEWLLIDDSLGEGGELETTGKKALPRNLKLQKYWNETKEDNFKWSSKKTGEGFKQTNQMIQALTNNQVESNKNINSLIKITSGVPQLVNQMGQQMEQYRKENISHLKLIQEYRKENVSWRKQKTKEIKKELKEGRQKKLGDF